MRKSKVKRSTLKARCDKLFSLRVRSRGYCELKGLDHILCSQNLQCMHIVGRRNYRLRWDLQNALAGCSGHHYYYANNPWEFNELIKEQFAVNYRYVNKHRNKLWDKDYERVLLELEKV